MIVGKLRKRLSFQEPTYTQGDSGQETLSYETDFSHWGSLDPLSSKEIILGEQITLDSTHRIYVRHDSQTETVRHDWRIVDSNGRYFFITSIRNIEERNEMLEILAKEQEGNIED